MRSEIVEQLGRKRPGPNSRRIRFDDTQYVIPCLPLLPPYSMK
jgi:hypothetical protein